MVRTGNAAVNWRVFKEAYTDFATATELTGKEEGIQAATLKTVMGKEYRQILSRLDLSDTDKKEPESEPSESDDELFVIEQVGTVKHNHKGQFFVPLNFSHELGKTTIKCQLDTGATCNVISFKDVCAILHTENPQLQPVASQLKCYDNSIINTLGKCTLQCNYHSKTYQLSFKVIDGNQKPLLSGITCTELGLITVHAVCNVTSTKLIEE